MKSLLKYIPVALSALIFVSCQDEKIREVEKIVNKEIYINEDFDPAKGVAKLSISHLVNGQPFQINKSFNDQEGNTYQFNEIRYWLSNIEFVTPAGEVVSVPNTYYLVENRDTLYYYGTTSNNQSTMKSDPKIREEVLVGNIPTGSYSKIRFSIGVDSVYNSNFTLRAGELDVNQMSQVGGWAWQTSYIFLRTKGTFLAKGGDPLSDATKFIAEIGGNSLYRTVELSLPAVTAMEAGSTAEIKLKADVLKLFGNGLPTVPDFKGSKPSGWSADPNLAPYQKFINASSVADMTTLSNNASEFITIDSAK
ncbi:hypothetical protein CLV98_101678 [Dyadobacter jejuensis]|uniref:Copper-binding protein MbnP-like domain-containing protein n=1 Tax=Dyadobacter jejuensis TaxID=1082580 RepID=A0A316AT83_9BACT|nr:MbnP family protein [Dyadobacter jejuensis]PWJ60494.1 hypothetical protein CLV98_101678 [Dyadobacter jejuensis]